MKIPFAAILLSLSLLTSAAVYQQESLGTTLDSVQKLVSVQGNLSFQQIIPGYNYSSTVTVSWAVPSGSTSGLENQAINVFVRVKPFTKDSWIVMESEGKKRKEIQFTLTCNVVNNACAADSNLAKSFKATIVAPQSASYPHSDAAIVEASLNEFEPSQEQLEEKETVKQIEYTQETISLTNISNSELLSQAQAVLNEARRMVDEGKFQAALSLVLQANEAIEKAVATPTPTPTLTPEPTATPVPSEATGLFTGRNLPFIAGLIVVALVAVAFLYANKPVPVDLDKVMDEPGESLVEKKGGESDLGALDDTKGPSLFSQPKAGEPGYTPPTNYLDRYKNKEL